MPRVPSYELQELQLMKCPKCGSLKVHRFGKNRIECSKCGWCEKIESFDFEFYLIFRETSIMTPGDEIR
ncbi:MAG: hypothetical protein OEZ48_00100 [Candidatus Bathyarchaeota archaeon]|nr:hypothetical protein [Candidatus Bathyarchaeota archaeon]MDH5686257.1 hypothetical protein [Candidatus Bathyarchaeota archaeon]